MVVERVYGEHPSADAGDRLSPEGREESNYVEPEASRSQGTWLGSPTASPREDLEMNTVVNTQQMCKNAFYTYLVNLLSWNRHRGS